MDTSDHFTRLRQKAGQQARLLGSRLADRHVSLAVTGLSGAGKTAFITSLVNQLLEATDKSELPFFSVVTQGRLCGVRRDTQPDLTLARFTYEDGMTRLAQSPPQWPLSTRGVSQIRLQLRFRNRQGMRKLLSEFSTLTLDITDYPGEWLLDLPLLELDYSAWSQAVWQDMQSDAKRELAVSFLDAVDNFDLDAPADELALERIANAFTSYLLNAKASGFQNIQPGRFVLPGELEGAPVLHFFPLNPEGFDVSNVMPESNLSLLVSRFEEYKKQVVKPFYQQHFTRFDRQIVLVDCLTALNRGSHSFSELQHAINWLLGSFHYGRSNILKRLFSPRIDKLVFAASKADHITPQQHSNLVKLLESMVHEARQQIQFEGVATESTAIASIKCSEVAMAQLDGQPAEVLKGREADGKQQVLFPGEVPRQCPAPDFWQQQGFDFPHFLPPQRDDKRTLPHIRMDQILEFVLGDKME